MTGRDLFPFGKHKGKTLQWVKDNEPSYIAWLRDQDWAEPKWSTLLDWFDVGDAATSTVNERKVISAEVDLLANAPDAFRNWWFVAYGERLRKQGEPLYIGYLRVALEAWNHCAKISADLFRDVPKPLGGDVMLPPLISPRPGEYTGQPKPPSTSNPSSVAPPNLAASQQKLRDNRDEEINF